MKLKKSPKANLENKKFIFFEMGLAIALLLIFFAFEWRVDVPSADDFVSLDDIQVEEIVVPITTTKVKLPPPPKVVTNILDIVDNDDFDEPDLEIIDAEADEKKEYDYQNVDEPTEDIGEDIIFVKVENMPEFPGGQKGLFRWLSKNVRYPSIAVDNGIFGCVYVGFVVDIDGSVTNVKVLRPVDPALDKEAVRVVKAMPKWKAGRQRGKKVRVSYTVPIKFQLNN